MLSVNVGPSRYAFYIIAIVSYLILVLRCLEHCGRPVSRKQLLVAAVHHKCELLNQFLVWAGGPSGRVTLHLKDSFTYPGLGTCHWGTRVSCKGTQQTCEWGLMMFYNTWRRGLLLLSYWRKFAKCFHTSGKHPNCTKNLINSFVLYMVPLKCFKILDVWES